MTDELYEELEGCRNPYFIGLSLAIAPKISSKLQNSNANSWKSCEFCANIKIKPLFYIFAQLK